MLPERKKTVIAYLKRMQLEGSAHNLMDWIEKNGTEEQVANFLNTLPEYIADHPRFVRKKNQFATHPSKSKNKVVIYCGPTFETWGPNTLKSKGLGGSEEAVVYLSRELAKLGLVVDVYCSIDQPGVYDGVNFIDIWKYDDQIPCDYFVAWRNSEYADYAPKSAKKYVWLHDVQKDEYWNPKRIKEVDKIMVLSKWHRENLPDIKDDKFFLTRNGIVKSDFSLAGHIPRDPYKCVYASSPDRGLDTLLELWPEIHKKVEDAHLHVFYGFSPTYDKLHANNDRMIEFKEATLKKLEELKDKGVVYHGKVSHPVLHEHFMSAGLWLYPTNFTEISCITAMKAQVAGMIPICPTLAALDETVQHGYKINFNMMDTRARQAFTNMTVDLLKDHDKQEKKRKEMMKWAVDYFDWARVAKEWKEMFTNGKVRKPTQKIPGKFAHLKLPHADQLRWHTIVPFGNDCYRVSYVIPSHVIFSKHPNAGCSRWLYFHAKSDRWAVLITQVKGNVLHLSNKMMAENARASDLSKSAMDWVSGKLALPNAKKAQVETRRKDGILRKISKLLGRKPRGKVLPGR